MDSSEYHRYLASREWALKKEAVKQRSGGICERCGGGPHRATHHLTYERVGHELLEDLQGVCEDCHKYLSGKSTYSDLYVEAQYGDIWEIELLPSFRTEEPSRVLEHRFRKAGDIENG